MPTSVRERPSVKRGINQVVDLALESSFDGDQMNGTVDYLLDQHRLSRRMRDAPPGARELLLRKKEQIMCAVMAMDTDGDGEVDINEFCDGLQTLGIELPRPEAVALFRALDSDASGSLEPRELEELLFGCQLSAERREEMREAANRQAKHESSGRQMGNGRVNARGLLRLLPLYFFGGEVQESEEKASSVEQ